MGNKPICLYGNSINLRGLYSDVPIECSRFDVYSDDSNLVYWDKSGDFDCPLNELGLTVSDGVIKFISTNKREVELWTMGVVSAMSMIRNWAYVSPIKNKTRKKKK